MENAIEPSPVEARSYQSIHRNQAWGKELPQSQSSTPQLTREGSEPAARVEGRNRAQQRQGGRNSGQLNIIQRDAIAVATLIEEGNVIKTSGGWREGKTFRGEGNGLSSNKRVLAQGCAKGDIENVVLVRSQIKFQKIRNSA